MISFLEEFKDRQNYAVMLEALGLEGDPGRASGALLMFVS